MATANGASPNAGKDFVQNITSNGVLSHAEKLSNLLRGFKSKTFKTNGYSFMLDKDGIELILKRHYPDYWDGSIKATQSFFEKSVSLDEITSAIYAVFMQNTDNIAKKGTSSVFSVVGNYKGKSYQLGFNRGKIGQFFPL